MNKLRKHVDKEVSEHATKIYRDWKKHFKEKLNKPQIEVRFDNATNKYRSSSRQLLEKRLQPHKVSQNSKKKYNQSTRNSFVCDNPAFWTQLTFPIDLFFAHCVRYLTISGVFQESTILAEAIERSVFQINSNTGTNYRRHIRNIVFTLQYQPDVQQKFLNKQLTVSELCLLQKNGKHNGKPKS